MVEFQINRITKNLIPAPQFTYNGAQQHETNERERWLEVEVEFAAAPAWTDELTAKYFILFNGKLLSGEVTHTNVPAGRELRSVMYVAPHTLARFAGNRPVVLNSVQNIAVQLTQGLLVAGRHQKHQRLVGHIEQEGGISHRVNTG